MSRVGMSRDALIEPDALPASDNAPATPNAVTTLLRPLLFDFFVERDMAGDLRLASALVPKVAIPLRGWFRRSHHIPRLLGISTFRLPRENPLARWFLRRTNCSRGVASSPQLTGWIFREDLQPLNRLSN